LILGLELQYILDMVCFLKIVPCEASRKSFSGLEKRI
jgi:hypothetical protein